MDFYDFKLDSASVDQSQAICELLNSAYRGTDGWTTEVDIISGKRADRNEIEAAIKLPNSYFFVANQSNQLASCIHITKKDDHAQFGFFAVQPSLQGNGLGTYVLKQAEIFAKTRLYSKKLLMIVVSQRTELIAFYERRGYRRTGQVENLPANIGIPKRINLTIDYLEKSIATT
ncbi:MAG TPA: GNAT family N-acetyltransferase [Nitrosomonas sp.]|nr:GNAT family N-acetyltransferase [Nitrosomonas sp.]